MSGEGPQAVSIAGRADWLADPALQKLLAALSADGEEARVAGGAVRDALLGQPAGDIDVATTNPPDQTIARAERAGFRTVPTGKEHGTITVIAGKRPFEVTTLRADVETFGRKARVVFGRDWRQDAERRDFTINALYARADGTVIDLVGGVADLERRNLRFIGDAEARIREDYLRILRFFRFFAWYGAGRPDADGLKACARLKDGLAQLSAERVWGELRKLLSAPDPSRAILWMRTTGVLSAILPESEKWGIDAVPGLVAAERDLGWDADPLLRFAAMLPPDPQRMKGLAERLRLSNAEGERLAGWASAPAPAQDMSAVAFGKLLYQAGKEPLRDRLRLALAAARARAASDDQALIAAGGVSRLLKQLEGWERPAFPLKGRDLEAIGVSPGKALGAMLRTLEGEWLDSGFALSRDALLQRAARLAAGAD
jgi:tRNA nucleotidyltransferase/poly(A) polymerase